MKLRQTGPIAAAVLFAAAAFERSAGGQSQGDLLPDMVVDPEPLADIRIDTETLSGRRLLRLATSTPNIGPGPLEIRGSTVIGDDRQEVLQRIYREDGSYWERLAGISEYHARHGHTHFDGWAVYRLRAVTAAGDAGAIVAEGDKTSFCLLDIIQYSALEGELPRYTTCGRSVQGISTGWADVYDRELDGQWIDVTDLPDGPYWLEAEVDPERRILEVPGGEDNNAARIRITLGTFIPSPSDRYEPNDTFGEASRAPEGAADSPNIGAITGRAVLSDLSMEDTSDIFRFRLPAPGIPEAQARVSAAVPHDFALLLFDSGGAFIRSATETLSLADMSVGEYYLAVTAHGDAGQYDLVVDALPNEAPSIELLEPGAGATWVEQAYEGLPVEWLVSDPDHDLVRISLFVDRDQTVDSRPLALGGYQRLDARAGRVVINTAALDLGVWHLYVEATDGGRAAGTWAPGSVIVYVKGDLDGDGHADRADWVMLAQRRRKTPSLASAIAGWETLLDMDRDADVDQRDVDLFRTAALNSASH